MKRNKRLLIGSAKIIFTIFFILIAFYFVDFAEVATSIAAADAFYIVFAVILVGVGQWAAALRFGLTLEMFCRPIGRLEGVRVFLVGNWFTQLLPTSLGGDAVRVMMIRRRVGTGRAVRAAILNRACGLLTLLAIPPLVWPLLPAPLAGHPMILALVAVCICTVFGVITAAFFQRRLRRLPMVPKRLAVLFMPLADLRHAMTNRRRLRLLLLSVIVAVSTVASFLALAVALGSTGDRLSLFCLAAFVIVSMHVPVSYAGWGLREVSALALLTLAGLSAAHALSISVLYGVIFFIAALPGLVLWHGSGGLTAMSAEGEKV